MDILYTPEDLEKELWSNMIEMEQLCMACHVSITDLKELLTDYSLFCGEYDRYPIKRKAAFYGFHRWLRREARFNKGKRSNNSMGGLVI